MASALRVFYNFEWGTPGYVFGENPPHYGCLRFVDRAPPTFFTPIAHNVVAIAPTAGNTARFDPSCLPTFSLRSKIGQVELRYGALNAHHETGDLATICHGQQLHVAVGKSFVQTGNIA